jgi:HK97 family phage prohead protease
MVYNNGYLNKAAQGAHVQSTYHFEVKALAGDGTFAGYASVFDVVDSQRDAVARGAFKASLESRTQPLQLLWQHQWENPIGSVESIFEDAHGLFIRGRLLMEVAQAREAHALLKAGVIRGLSIGYSVKHAERDLHTGVRLLKEIDLWEVSVVTLPANEAAQVTVVKSGPPDFSAFVAAMEYAQRALKC